MPAKSIVVATKNNFFTYFQVDGQTVAYRERTQIWNSGGISIQVQGDLPPAANAGTYNSFGKKHLLTTAGGDATKTNDRSAQGKAMRMLTKRMKVADGGINPTGKREQKLKGIKDGIGGDTKKRHPTAVGHFELKAYGDQKTNKNTVILLDTFANLDEVAACFAEAINDIKDWATNPSQDVDVLLNKDSVMTVETGKPPVYANAVEVSVYFQPGAPDIYHVYHLGDAYESMGLMSLFGS
ncbi:hypothetical protein [Falsiroseomonas oryziterrae]|uniref:hypothetical protein n=1 Tax=Falsiroseomonas oryziterrae TaxID=2911368 RepID=UPI001F1AA170|nr:hypothetical protein [Roseomonas sp. NPKOSM-4]